MKRKIIAFSLLLFLLADLVFSFLQYYHTPLDGDMAGGIVPAADVKPVLHHPLGTITFLNECSYPNPNRFFSHWVFKEYFTITPLVLQKFTEPIDSVYLSCALFKALTQFMLIILLAIGVSGSRSVFKMDFLLA